MCLISKWRFPKRAKEDIVCFKVLMKRNGKFYPPFRNDWNEPINIDKVYEAKGDSLSIDKYTKGKGYIHVFMTCPEKSFLKYLFYNCERIYLFECIIPKGTKYHIGERDCCAKKIKFITQVPIDD